ncbi:1-acylglycerol-3-phosphate O-acyltransferase [Hanseniaspora uvarum]|nr:1-acylglycerol-3-phosphate O-acyltransferase [Hanseniaspora uvarum]
MDTVKSEPTLHISKRNSFLPKVKYYYRSTCSIILLGTCAFYGIFASIYYNIKGTRQLGQYATAKAYALVMKKFLGIEVKVEGRKYLETSSPCIFIANHQSALDILVLGETWPKKCVVTAKKALKYVPFLGWFMSLSGALFLDRSNRSKSLGTLNNGIKEIIDIKGSIWMFVEGTRSHTTKLEMLPFKKGAFWLAKDSNLPIVPVIISNTSTINNNKLKIFNQGTIHVKVLEPISLKDVQSKEDMNAFVDKVETLMVNELKDNVGYATPTSFETGLPKEYAS